MNLKCLKKIIGLFTVLLLVLTVSCTGEVKNGDRVVSLSFDGSVDNSSRGFILEFVEDIAPDRCFWTYTAVKTDGGYSTGASEKDMFGKLIEKPLNSGSGFNGFKQNFSTGTWTFSIFGYTDSKYTKLAYRAEKTGVALSSATTVMFTLEGVTPSSTLSFDTSFASYADCVYSEDAALNINISYANVPVNSLYLNGSSFVVEVFEDTTKIASSITNVGTTEAGKVGLFDNSKFYLSKFIFEDGKKVFSEGNHTLKFVATLTSPRGSTDSSTVNTEVASGTVVVPFYSGVETTISGDLDNLQWFSEERHLVGGRIYYIDPTLNGANYRFYDASGSQIEPNYTYTVDKLKNAYTYSVSNKAADAPDRFYVFNKKTYYIGHTYFYGTHWGCEYKGLGAGKKNFNVIYDSTARRIRSGKEGIELTPKSGTPNRRFQSGVNYLPQDQTTGLGNV